MIKLRPARLLCCAAFITVPAGFAQAQDAPTDVGADENVDEIVVTAQGREQSLQDVPVAVTVTTGETLQKSNLLNLEDVAIRMPGVRVAPAPVSDFVTIRGVGSSLNLGFEQSVGTFVDGLYRGRARSTRAALFDIERVEVLKGPQTTFFGNNTIAGALNITTRKPRHKFEVNATGFYAPNIGEYLVEGGLTLPLTETLAMRVAARQSGMDGYIVNENLGGEGPDKNEKVGRVALNWQPTSGIKVDARVDGGRIRNSGVGNFEYFGCPPDPALGPATGPCARFLAANNGIIDDVIDRRSGANPSFFDYDFVEGSLRTEIDVGANTLYLATGYFWHNSHVLNDVLPVPANQGGSVVGTQNAVSVDTDEHYRQFSQEIRFSSPDEGFFSYMVGGYYAHTKLAVDFYQGLYFAPFGANSGGEYTAATPVAGQILNRESADIFSAFAATTFRPAEALRLNLSLRYSSVTKKGDRSARIGTSGLLLPSAATFIPGNATTQTRLLPVVGYDIGNFLSPKRTDDKFMPAASIQYDVTEDVMAYASYAKGFKAGGYSILQSKSEFDPETVDSFEAGVKSVLFDRVLTLNLNAFHSKYKNLQESTSVNLPNGSSSQIVGNVASTVAKGVELGLVLQPSDGLSLTADISYLDARYTDYPGAPCTAEQKVGNPTCLQDLSGKRRAFAPEWSGNVGASYDTALTDALKLSLQGNVYFSSFTYQQPVADRFIAQPGYAKIDARIGVGGEDGRWEIALVGKNLTNKLTAGYRQNTPGSQAFQALADPPRSVGIQFTIKN